MASSFSRSQQYGLYLLVILLVTYNDRPGFRARGEQHWIGGFLIEYKSGKIYTYMLRVLPVHAYRNTPIHP